MFKKILTASALLASVSAFADLSTGRHDAIKLHYGETTKGDVKVFGNDFIWDLPVFPTQNSSLFLTAGLSRWTDDSSQNNSFFGFHIGNGVKFLLDSPSESFFPYAEFVLGVAYFGEKNFGGDYSLESSLKLEADAQVGLTFGRQSEYEVGVGYTHYFQNGGGTVDLGPQIYFGIHF